MDRSRVIQGGIEAATPVGRIANVPIVHPRWGKSSPYFYGVSFTIVNSWGAYVDIVLNQIGVIVLNGHGEIVPIPSGYTREAWTDKIAEAMYSRRLTWINVGGYPFYYTFYQSSLVGETWGEGGFQHLVRHILGPNTVTLWPPTGGLAADLTTPAQHSIYGTRGGPGWWLADNAVYVNLDRPLKKGDFKDTVLMPLYGRLWNSETYWEGAVLAFAKPGQRFKTADMHGFGNFVHLGTSQTYAIDNAQTDTDFYRGYMAVAAALWAEASRQSPRTETKSISPGHDLTLHVNPVVLGFYYVPGTSNVMVRLGFGLYGGELWFPDVTSCISQFGGEVTVDVNNKGRSEVLLKADLQASRNGDAKGIRLQNAFNENQIEFGLMVGTASYLIAFSSALAPFAAAVDGLLLLSDWSRTVAGSNHVSFSGTDRFDSSVSFRYTPNGGLTSQTATNKICEIQSWVVVDVQITPPKSDWQVTPIGYNFILKETSTPLAVQVGGEVSLAFRTEGAGTTTVTIFHDDFEGDFSDWTSWDSDRSGGRDYWGLAGIEVAREPYVAYSAQVGYNSVKGGLPNTSACSGNPCYDNGMNAYLMHDLSRLNLQAYRTITIRYRIQYMIKSGDNLYLEVLSSGAWSLLRSYLGEALSPWYWDAVPVPRDAQSFRFRFVSNNDDQVWRGAEIDQVELQGEIPNDPPYSNSDAGNSFATATLVSPGSTTAASYPGYLTNTPEDPEDWYQFNVPGANYEVHVSLNNLVPGQSLQLELYDGGNVKMAGPGTTLAVISQSGGNWRARVFATSGYGSYSLSIQVTPAGSGGGGGGSVAYGTLVTMPDGSKKPVQNINVGDHVLTYNPWTKTTGTAVVGENTEVNVNNFIVLHTSAPLPFRADHNPSLRLFTEINGQTILVPITDVRVGDRIYSYDLGWVEITKITFEEAGRHTVFDLLLSVDDAFIANGYLDPPKNRG